MFRLRALRRAWWKHSFLFNPLAARPVQHGGDKARVYLSFEQDFFLPMVLCRQLAEPRKGRWEAGVLLPALMLLVVLAWVNHFTPHQYKHRCWCYQRLLLVCLFVCIKPVTGKPQAWEHPEQSEPSAVVFTNTMSWLKSALSLTHKMPEVLQGNTGTVKERPVLSPAGASTDWDLVVRLPQQKGAVVHECISHCVSEPGAPGSQNQVGWTSLNHRCFIIKLNIFFNRARSPRGDNSNPTVTPVV